MSSRGRGKRPAAAQHPTPKAMADLKNFFEVMEEKQKEKVLEWVRPYIEALEERVELLELKVLDEEEEVEEEEEEETTNDISDRKQRDMYTSEEVSKLVAETFKLPE